MDRFEEMRVFAAVVDAGSFVRAADALDLSKTAVSRHVSELESRLGVRLLHRTTRKLSLTAEGQVFHARCKALLGAVEAAEAEITAGSVQPSGVLRLNVPVTFGLMHLAPLWPDFMQRYPQVTLDVSLADRLVDLVEEGFDLAVRIAQLSSSTLVSRQLATTRMVLCASPEYLRRHGQPQRPADLAQHRVLAYSLFHQGEHWAFDGPQGREVVKVNPILRTNSGDTCVAAALAHQGVVLQPSFLVGEPLRQGDLVEVLPGHRSGEMGIYAVYPSRQHLPPKVRAMVDFLVEAFRTTAWPA
ncbi:LysR family transcriptional regulator [Hydrogenophaga sp.]|uniref:LysR family transcriptional regulator n=1 Tax=Hydrogenophaga sp. TaxID=1904254 RepID=UPI0035B0606B